jgi:hypothetical protein
LPGGPFFTPAIIFFFVIPASSRDPASVLFKTAEIAVLPAQGRDDEE